MKPLDRCQRVYEELCRLQLEIGKMERTLDGYDFRAKFEKAKRCLQVLYRDHTYDSRSDWVNEVLDDTEVREWIREQDS